MTTLNVAEPRHVQGDEFFVAEPRIVCVRRFRGLAI